MADKKTFHGKTYRAQLAVWDLRGQYGNGKLNFSVCKLPQSDHKSTAYSAGYHVYYGPSFTGAVQLVSAIVQRNVTPELPEEWRQYETESA